MNYLSEILYDGGDNAVGGCFMSITITGKCRGAVDNCALLANDALVIYEAGDKLADRNPHG